MSLSTPSPVTTGGAATESPSESSWGAVAVLGIAAFALISTEFLPVGLLPQIAHELEQSEGRTGLMVTLPSVMGALAAPLTIAFAGRLDRRWLLGGLVGLLALSNFIVAMSGSFAAILFGRLLMGIAVGGFWTVGGSLGPRLKPGPQAARASALILSGVSIGTVAGVPAGALLGELVGWRWAFGAAGAISLVVLALLLALLPALPSTATRNGLREIPSLLREPKVQLGLATILLLFGGQFSAYTYISPFLLQVTGIAPVTLGAVLLGYGASGFAGNLVGGWLAERDLRGALVATGLVLGMSVLGLVLLGQGNVSWAVALVIIWGLGFGMLPIAVQSWMFGAAPQRLEAVQAMYVSAAQAAIGGGALLGGLLADSFGIASAMWLGALSALAISLVVVGQRFWRRQAPQVCCAQAS
ncbi:MFS transporter [Rhodoferax sediminis]|uniref:MFS transporter n=1 Tax=Rhodoferax sediminis TaxID=2509614 RepID=A0A515DE63_9BURK|nr:MFS transporter [Rhodoferax sediminis]QDL38711.1 MFS transporter [Rhodoferax sediminis]